MISKCLVEHVSCCPKNLPSHETIGEELSTDFDSTLLVLRPPFNPLKWPQKFTWRLLSLLLHQVLDLLIPLARTCAGPVGAGVWTPNPWSSSRPPRARAPSTCTSAQHFGAFVASCRLFPQKQTQNSDVATKTKLDETGETRLGTLRALLSQPHTKLSPCCDT